MIYLCADTHGDCYKLEDKFIKQTCNNRYPEYTVVLGDWGFLWPSNSQEIENFWLNWLEKKTYTKILFIDGNHDWHPRLNALPKVNLFNSVVGQVSDNIFHLKRGHIYDIDNKTFFCLGGAESIDKENRIRDISWWPEEVPTYKDYLLAIDNLEKVGYSVDYVLTHTCPRNIKSKLFANFNSHYKSDFNDSTEIMLNSIDEQIKYRKWFFGHMHFDKSLNMNYKSYQCLYEKGVCII